MRSGLTAVYSLLASGIRDPGGSIADRLGWRKHCPFRLVGAAGRVRCYGSVTQLRPFRGGFAIPPVMGVFVGFQGDVSYSTGFTVFIPLQSCPWAWRTC